MVLVPLHPTPGRLAGLPIGPREPAIAMFSKAAVDDRHEIEPRQHPASVLADEHLGGAELTVHVVIPIASLDPFAAGHERGILVDPHVLVVPGERLVLELPGAMAIEPLL